MITDLLGSPLSEDLTHITSKKSAKNLLSQGKPPSLNKLYALSPTISHEAVHLLSEILVFNPVSLSNETRSMYSRSCRWGRPSFHWPLNCCFFAHK